MAYDLESRDTEPDRRETGVGREVSPGKASRTQRLGSNAAPGERAAEDEQGAGSYAFYPDWADTGADPRRSQPAGDDPFALHLGSGERGAKHAPSAARGATADAGGGPATSEAPTATAETAADGEAPLASDNDAASDQPASSSEIDADAEDHPAAEGDAEPAGPAATSHGDDDSLQGAHASPSREAPAGDNAGVDVVGANAIQIEAQAQSEYHLAISAIGQRESLMRGSFAQQRAAIGTIAATQAALARSDAKKAGERIRGRNGVAARSIAQIVDGEAARMREAAQQAMARMSAADKQVRPAIREAAANSATYAQLDLRDGAEGELLNELRDRLMPRAVTEASSRHRDARARDIDKMASTRDANIREMRRAGQMLATQVDVQLRDVQRALVGSGEALAAVIHRNARSQLSAIDAAERSALAFFARARRDAQRILAGGMQTATAVRAAAADATNPAAAVRVATAAASVAPQLAAQRGRLLDKVDSVVERASSTVARGVVEFDAECGAHRAMAHGDHAGIEAKLAGDVAGKVGQLRVEWAKETDVFIISANSFAAAVEFSRAQLIAQLPAQFGGILRSAILERRKSRLEGAWDALSGLVTTIGKFVAAALAIVYAPILFGVAALLGKVGVLVNLFRDVAHALVGMVEAVKERYKILFRSWDGWPWYGKVMGVWATTLLAIGDVVGLPSLYEGATGRELISNRELSESERGAKGAGGGLAAVTTFIPAKIHADKVARNATARTMGAELAETEALAQAHRQLPDGPSSTPALAAESAGATAEQVILQRADLEIAEAAQRVKPQPDTLDVFVHGEVDNFIVFDEGMVPRVLSHRSLAKYIEKSGKSYKKIRLIACKSGLHPQGAAQHLANKLNAKLIEAPTDKVHIHGDGSMTIGPSDTVNSGTWEPFSPKPSRYRYTEYRAPEVTETRYERFRRERAEKAAGQGNEVDATPDAPSEAQALELTNGEAKSMGRRPRPRDSADSLFDKREPGSSVLDDASELRHGDDPADLVPDADDAGDLGLSRDGDRRTRHVPKSEAPSQLGQEAGAGVLSSNRLGITRPPRHHVLPQAEIEFFQARGFPGRAIDDFTIEMPTPLHEEVHGLNQSMARRYWPEQEWNTEVMARLREAEALKQVQLRRQLRAQKKPAAEIDQILATDGKLTPDEIWSVVNQVMVKFKIDGLPFVKYDAPASVPVEASTPSKQP